MSYALGTPVWALCNGTWRPAAVASSEEGVSGINLIFVDQTNMTVPEEAVEPFDANNTQRQVDPAIKQEVASFVEMLNYSQSAAAAGEDDSASSSSSEDDETEGQATQPAEGDDDATLQRKLDKKAKKALKKEKKKEKKRDKKEKKKDKSEKKSKKDKKESASQNDAEEDDEDLLGIVDASPAKDKSKKDKKKDKKEKKKDKKSKKEKREKRRHEAEMSQTQDDSSEEDEEESEDEMGLKASDLSDAAIRNVSRFRGSGGGGSSYSQRSLGSQSGPIIPHSASDLVLQRAEQSSRPTSMNIQGSDRRLLTDPHLDNVASQLKGLSTYYKAEVTKLSMGTISAGTGMTQSQGQVMPISEVDYLRAAERRLTAHRNALRILQFRQAQLILKYRENIDQDDADDYLHRITTLGAAITKEAKYNVMDVFMKADAEAKVPSNNSTSYPGIPNLRPVLYHRADEPYEKTGIRHHQFSYIDKICEPASEMHLKAVSTIQTVPSKLQAEEIRRRQMEASNNHALPITFDLGTTLPARLKGSFDGTTTRLRGSVAGLESLMTTSTPRGEASNVRIMTQWRAFRDFDVDTQKKRNHNYMEDYLTTNRPQDIHPPTYTSRNFDFGAQRLDERAEKWAQHVLTRAMSTQNLGGASGTGQLSLSALLAGGNSTQLGGSSSNNLPASDFVRTLTQGGVSQLNITDFGVSRNLKNKQARLDAGSSGLLQHAEPDVASVYSSLGMESEKSVDFEGRIGAGGMAPVDFGFDVEDAFKSQMIDPGYPDISDIKDLRHVKSVDLPSVGPASEGIDSQASSWQEAHDERHRPSATAGAGNTSTNDHQFNDALQQRSPSPNAASPASNMIRDVLVSECRVIYNRVKNIISEAKKRDGDDFVVCGGSSGNIVFKLNCLNALHSCLVTPVQLKSVITTLRDRILQNPEIQETLAEFYTKNEASVDIPVAVLLPQNTQKRIQNSVMTYLARKFFIPTNGLLHMRLRKPANATTTTKQQAAQAPGTRRPRQSTYAYDE